MIETASFVFAEIFFSPCPFYFLFLLFVLSESRLCELFLGLISFYDLLFTLDWVSFSLRPLKASALDPQYK